MNKRATIIVGGNKKIFYDQIDMPLPAAINAIIFTPETDLLMIAKVLKYHNDNNFICNMFLGKLININL
jgi:hypothetical protein